MVPSLLLEAEHHRSAAPDIARYKSLET